MIKWSPCCDGRDEWTLTFDLAAKALLPCFKEDINNFGFATFVFLLEAFLVIPPPPPLPPPPPKPLVVPISREHNRK